MNVSPAVILITLGVGVPLMMLALGVLYHAYLAARQPVDLLEQHVDALATESTEELLLALQEAVEQMQQQLSHQREALAGMLSDRRPMLASVPSTERPMAAGDFVAQSRPQPEAQPAGMPQLVGMRGRITQLVEEGLSDRAIARELRIGLEEVRIARMRQAAHPTRTPESRS